MVTDLRILKGIYNAFDPFAPLQSGDPVYVDCQSVRGDGNVLVELGKEVLFSDVTTYQLYAGHKGAGKSTELQRLVSYLRENGCFVVYFAADEDDIDPEDAQYADILLACTRRLLEAFKDLANPSPLLTWVKGRWQDLKDLALSEVAFDKLDVEAQIAMFAKLTANIRAVPSMRQEIRRRVDPHTVTLIDALNEFIADAQKHLKSQYDRIVIVADNLDRIVPTPQQDGRSNHEQIFIDRSEQLKALDCHIIYTVPISMLFSERGTDLRSNYGEVQILPMVMIQTRDGEIYEPGLNAMRQVITRRVEPILREHGYEGEAATVFDSTKTFDKLCLMSGGHLRELLLLIRGAVKRSDTLPISVKAVQRSITEARNTYRRMVEDGQWDSLAEVALSKRIPNKGLYRELLFSRCVLEYRLADEEVTCWYDVHPLIRGIEEFQAALQRRE